MPANDTEAAAHYLPGGGLVVVRAGSVALVAPSAPSELVSELWDLCGQRAGSTRFLRAVLAHGFEMVGPFAFAIAGAQARTLLLRGDVGALIGGDGGPRLVLAGDAETWLEEVVEPDAAVVLFGGDEAGPVHPLPIESGIVTAASVAIGDVEALLAAAESLAPQASGVPMAVQPGRPDADEPAPAPTAAVHPAAPAATPRPAPAAAAADPGPVPDAVAHHPDRAAGPGQRAGTATEPFPGPPRDGARGAPLGAATAAGGRGAHVAPAPATHAPRLALRVMTGEMVPLDRPVLVGRSPVYTGSSTHQNPRLLVVPSPSGDISRTHARIEREGDRVVVTDLESTNGLLIRRGYQPPERPRAGVVTPVEVGALLDLGDGVTLLVEAAEATS